MLQLEILLKNATLLSESIDLNASIPSSDDKNVENEATENDENIFSPSTLISLPISSRAISINDKLQQELDTNTIKSEIYENSSNPQYNFSTKFNYNDIQHLCNDLLLSDGLNCNIFLKNTEPPKKGKKDTKDEDIIFGEINMKWKEWILSAIDSKICSNWSFFLPILDPQNNTLKKGEIDLEIIFYTKVPQNENINNENIDKSTDKTEDEKEEISWQKCTDFMSLIPQKYSYLIINGNNIKSIPNNWWSKNDDNTQHSISISFEAKCSDNYSEKIEMDLPLQINDNDDNQQKNEILINKEWMFFIDEFGINYYLHKAQNKQSFDIQFDHIVAEQDKKKGIIKSIKDKFCLSLQLRPFIRPGTCTLSQINYSINWMINEEIIENKKEEDTENTDAISSDIELQFRFNDPLIEPYIKPIPAASDLIKNSEIRKEHQNANKNNIHIDSKTKFQAIIATIQEELKNKYLKICTTYNDMTKQERKEAFMNYLLSSTHGQTLTNIISKIVADIAKEEMYQESNVITQELTMKLRAKLEKACNPVFEEVLNKNNDKPSLIEDNECIPNTKNEIKPFLPSSNIENIYAEPLRNIDTIKTLIEIAFLNQDYETANKWIIQGLAICQDKKLYCKLYMDLAFVLSQKKCDISMPYHCIRHTLSMTENKEILYTNILMLCEYDKLEEAEPFMNRLLELFPNDPYVQILKGIFEHLMEEIEDAQNIWKQQFDIIQQKENNDDDNDNEEEKAEELEYETTKEEEEEDKDINNKYDLYDLWIFVLKIALKFDCKQMIKTILTVSKPFFQDIDKYKIDFVLLEHEALIYNKKYEIALCKLGEAILMNDNDTRLWLYIGSTYYLLNKLNDSIEAFQRHINECNKQQILPNLMAMFKLIQIYLIVYKNNNNNKSDNNYLQNALSLIEICWNRIENHQIYNNDNLNVFISFENKNNNKNFINALKYKLSTIQAQYFNTINNTTSALSYYANASSIHPLDDNLWKQIDKIYNSLQN